MLSLISFLEAETQRGESSSGSCHRRDGEDSYGIISAFEFKEGGRCCHYYS